MDSTELWKELELTAPNFSTGFCLCYLNQTVTRCFVRRHHPWVNGAAMLSKCLVGVLEVPNEEGGGGEGASDSDVATTAAAANNDTSEKWTNDAQYVNEVMSNALELLECTDPDE